MSSILTVPVEVLMDVFQGNDPAGTEALQLTCRRFHDTILQNVDALPTRLVCALTLDGSDQAHLYREPANSDSGAMWDPHRERIARSGRGPHEIRKMYKTFGR
ncbi:hypothetical protein AAVH_34676, partial [Aphelenchoides avenae]